MPKEAKLISCKRENDDVSIILDLSAFTGSELFTIRDAIAQELKDCFFEVTPFNILAAFKANEMKIDFKFTDKSYREMRLADLEETLATLIGDVVKNKRAQAKGVHFAPRHESYVVNKGGEVRPRQEEERKPHKPGKPPH